MSEQLQTTIDQSYDQAKDTFQYAADSGVKHVDRVDDPKALIKNDGIAFRSPDNPYRPGEKKSGVELRTRGSGGGSSLRMDNGQREFTPTINETQGSYEGQTLYKPDEESARAIGHVIVKRAGGYEGTITGANAVRATEIITNRATNDIEQRVAERSQRLTENLHQKAA